MDWGWEETWCSRNQNLTVDGWTKHHIKKTKNSIQLLRHLRYIALKVAYSCAGSGDT